MAPYVTDCQICHLEKGENVYTYFNSKIQECSWTFVLSLVVSVNFVDSLTFAGKRFTGNFSKVID